MLYGGLSGDLFPGHPCRTVSKGFIRSASVRREGVQTHEVAPRERAKKTAGNFEGPTRTTFPSRSPVPGARKKNRPGRALKLDLFPARRDRTPFFLGRLAQNSPFPLCQQLRCLGTEGRRRLSDTSFSGDFKLLAHDFLHGGITDDLANIPSVPKKRGTRPFSRTEGRRLSHGGPARTS